MRQPETGDRLRGISRAVTGPGQGSLSQAPAASRRPAEPGEAAGVPGRTAGGQGRASRPARGNSLLPPGLPRAGHRHRLLRGCGGGASTEHREKVVFGLAGGRHIDSRPLRSLPRFSPRPSPQPPGRSYRLRRGPDQHLQVVAPAGVPLEILHHG